MSKIRFLLFTLIAVLLFVAPLFAPQSYSQCVNGYNTSGKILLTSLPLEGGNKVVKIYCSRLDSLTYDSSTCFDVNQWRNIYMGDSLTFYDQRTNGNVYYKIRVTTVKTASADSIKAFLLGKMFDEGAWTVIDTLNTNNATFYVGKLSTINAVTLTNVYPLWGVRLYGEGASGKGVYQGVVEIYFWSPFAKSTAGGEPGMALRFEPPFIESALTPFESAGPALVPFDKTYIIQ